MALGRRKALKIPDSPIGTDIVPSVIASAARIDVAAARWPEYRYTDEGWQREAWGFYETNGELSYTAEYIGAAMSLVRFYIRHVDENGVPQGEVDDDPEVAAIADTMLGGPAKRSQVLAALSVGLTVAGACYLIGRAARPGFGDEWTVVAAHFVRMYGGVVAVDFGNGQWVDLDPRRDIIIKVWRQSRQRPLLAQAPTRALLPTFALLQKLRMFMMSEVNSRIAAGGGVWFLPDELTFPGDADNNIPPGAPGFAQQIYESLESNIDGMGTAAAVGPTIGTGPIDIIERIPDPKRFDIPLSEHAMEYRQELIKDVARGMNVPTDIVEGVRQTNHWSAWWSTEEFTTKTVGADAVLLCDAFNVGYLYGALKKAGKDPARFSMWFDLAPLHNTADKFTDTLNLFREGAVNLETLLASANYTMVNAPDETERLQRQLWTIVERDPTLLQSEGVREFLGIEIEGFVPELITPPPPPPVPDQNPEPRQVGSKPETPDTSGQLIDDLEASLVRNSPILPVANAVVLAALAVAGRRLRSSRNEFRNMYRDTDPTIMHTKIRVGSNDQGDDLLDSAAFLTASASLEPVDAEHLIPDLKNYIKGLFRMNIPHSPELLDAFLKGRPQ